MTAAISFGSALADAAYPFSYPVLSLMGAQRLLLYSQLAAEEDPEELSFTQASQTNLLMCHLGLFAPEPLASGRRLQSTTSSINSNMLRALADGSVTLILVVASVIALHAVVVLNWHHRVNRAFYEKRTTAFIPLPAKFICGNLELMVVVSLMSGPVSTVFVVMGFVADSHTLSSGLWALTATVLLLTLVFYTSQINRLRKFRNAHAVSCWQPALGPTQDPLLQVLVFATGGLIRAGPRSRGTFNAPAEAQAEPARTERAITRMLSWNTPKGDAAFFSGNATVTASKVQALQEREELGLWIDAGTSNVAYKMGLALLQLGMIVVVSITLVVKRESVEVEYTVFAALVVFKIAFCVWHTFAGHSDRLNAVILLVISSLEMVIIICIFAAVVLANNGRVAGARSVALVPPQLILCGVYIPLGFECYNSIITPFIKIVRDGRDSGASVRVIFVTLLFTPLLFLLKVFQLGGAASGLLQCVGGHVKATAKSSVFKATAVTQAGGNEEPDNTPADAAIGFGGQADVDA